MIQFKHQRASIKNNDFNLIEGTIALEPPTKGLLEQVFNSFANQTIFKLGLTIKSEKDQFEKKKGREEAIKKMSLYHVNFLSVKQNGLNHTYKFSADVEHNKNKYSILLKINTNLHNDMSQLVYGEINYATK